MKCSIFSENNMFLCTLFDSLGFQGWYIERDDMVCYAVIILQRSGVLQYNIYTVAYSIG